MPATILKRDKSQEPSETKAKSKEPRAKTAWHLTCSNPSLGLAFFKTFQDSKSKNSEPKTLKPKTLNP